MKCIKIQKALLLSMLFSSALFADILDRIEYKLNRVLRDVDTVVAGNTANCTPITQGDINVGGGVYTISSSGEYCVTEDVTGTIVVDADCVSINLESHTVSAGGAATAFSVDNHEGLVIFNGCIADASDAGVLVSTSTAVELFSLHMHDHDNDAIRVNDSAEVYVHNIDFIGGTTVRALGVEDSSGVVVSNSEMIGYTSSGNGILEIIGSDCVLVQGVTVCGTSFTSDTDAGAIHVVDSTDFIIENSSANNATSAGDNPVVHGILIDTCSNSKVMGTQTNGNEDGSGIELVGSNANVALIECLAMQNDSGFDFAQTSTATCCLVQDCRAISNTSAGFAHITTPLTTTFVGNVAQCNGDAGATDYVIDGGDISLQGLSLLDGTMLVFFGNAALGARFTNLTVLADV